MGNMRELYEDMILDHNRSPRNWGRMEHPTHVLEGFNPGCGDWLKVYLEVVNDVVKNVLVESEGCAISTASASLMSEAVIGLPVGEVERLFRQVQDKLTGGDDTTDLGKLEVLTGVRDYPNRVKCATLAWHALHGALECRSEVVSTEGDGA